MKKICNVIFRGLSSLLLLFLFCMASFTANAQTKTITGTITDSDGLGLPGVNIVVKGTTIGTVSDFDGNYKLDVADPVDVVLVYSFIGFETQEIELGSQTSINVTLKTDAELLEDVVVVGFGRQKKETVVGSITQAKGEELLQTGNVTTVSESLTGILPGVTTMQAAGQPGSTATNILIRGQSTWSNNTPLYVVDGVERDFNDLDPNEIESISVLKDASATAVYGVKAANGVILVTTKRGREGKTKVNFTASWGLKDPTIDTDYYAEYPVTLEHWNIAAMNDYEYDKFHPQSLIDTWRDPNRDMDFYTYTAWINELLTTGTTSQYNLNVSGGNKFVSYFTSFGYQYDGDIYDFEKQEDFDPRTYQKKYTWRTNLDFNFSKTTKFKVGLSGNFKNWNGNSMSANTNAGVATGGGGGDMGRMWQTPLIGPKPELDDGRLTTEQGAVVHPNFLRIERQGQWIRRSNTLYTDFALEQNITKHLVAKGKFSYNYHQRYESSIRQTELFYYPIWDPATETYTGWEQEGDPNAVKPAPNVNGESIDGSSNSLYYELALDYSQTFGDHAVSALALFNRRRAQSGVSFPRYEESWVGRATYAYKSKYLAEFNGAYNGNENWAPGLRFGFFPSMAVGWVASEESFIKDNISWIDFLKLRYSYGEIGSDKGIGNNRFIYQSQYDQYGSSNGQFYYGDPLINYLPLYLEGSPAVPENTWETSIKQDLALEFAILKDQLQGTVELFDEKRKDILMQRRTVPPWFGNQPPFANIGETKNHGIDWEVKWNSKIGKDFSYFLRANMSLSESRIVERDDPAQTVAHERQEGKPIGWTRGFLSDGLYQSWDEAYNSTISSFYGNLIPGSLSFVDYNGDGIINEFDKVPINNPSFATKSYAFSLGFNYKGFGVHAMFNGMFDITKYLENTYLFEYSSAGTSQWQLLNNEQMDFWSPENPDGKHPVLHTTANKHDDQSSTYNNRAADFLRFKTLEVKYRFPKSLQERIGLFDSFEVYVNGNNLYTWSKLPDEFDPEQRTLRVYPITKRYNLGVRLSF